MVGLDESSGTARMHDASNGAKGTAEDIHSNFFQVLFSLELKSIITGMSVWAHACRRSVDHWSSDVSLMGSILDI